VFTIVLPKYQEKDVQVSLFTQGEMIPVIVDCAALAATLKARRWTLSRGA